MNRSTERDFDQRIADWLDGDPDMAPRQALDTVLAAYPSIPQRRAWRGPWRFLTMSTQFRVATAAGVAVLAVAGAMIFLRPSPSGPGATSSTNPVVNPSTNPSQAISPSVRSSAWTPTGSLAEARTDFGGVALQDGRVLVLGGRNGSGNLATAEIYDPSTGRWSSAGTMHTARVLPTVTLLATGKVLVTGGFFGGPDNPPPDLFDPATGTWTAAPPMTVGRGQATATLLADGRVLLMGGTANNTVGTAELFDPKKGSWRATGNMTAWRASATGTLLPDGTVLVVGGFTTGDKNDTAELYDPASGTFRATGSMAHGRVDGQTATLLENGKVLVTGDASSTAELYDPATGKFVAAGILPGGAQGGQTATVLADGRVLIAAGVGPDSAGVNTAQIFDGTAATWSSAPPLPDGRISAQAARLADGRVLIVGGSTVNTTDSALATAVIFDPAGS